ncbi:MAG TPA: T9SS type A sorting domain-containing protein, partial [Bacteroidota bacterium]|nr:T9SS type A sorting domain-containing protein [Bacteroidota bacterium]
VWVRRHNGYPTAVPPVDVATALVTDDSGNVYVTGYGPGPTSGQDVFTVKYAPNGDSLWAQYYNFPATNGGDRGWAIALDAFGNVIVAGESWGGTAVPPATGFDYLVLKYSNSGTLVFAQRQTASSGPSDDAAQAVATDSAGNLYVTGYALSGAWYIATLRFSSAGVALWQQNYPAPGLQGKKIAVVGGSVYVGGATYDPPDYLALKYDTAGLLQWARLYNNGGSDNMMDMAIDDAGSVYITGSSQGVVNGDYATVKYNAAGDSQWVQRYASSLGYDDIAKAIHVFSPGELVVSGTSAGQVVTIRYSESPVSHVDDGATPQAFSLAQNYPNPFNPSTTIGYTLPVAAEVKLSVFDLLGREIAGLVNGRLEAGSHSVIFDGNGLASGVYLYRLDARGSDGRLFTQTKRFVLLK